MPSFMVSNSVKDARAALKKAVPSMAAACHINTAHGDMHFNGKQAAALAGFVKVMLSEGKTTDAFDFYNEVIDNTESISAVAEEYGDRTVADLFYLLGAMLTEDGFIEGLSRIGEFVQSLPSADRWMKRINVEEAE